MATYPRWFFYEILYLTWVSINLGPNNIYASPHIGMGLVLELGLIFHPVLELGRGRPQIVAVPV